MIFEGDLLATWEVSGETFAEMQDEAISDAGLLMEGIDPKTYHVFVYGAEPMKDTHDKPMIKDGIIERWKAKAGVVWSQLSLQSSNVDAVPADSEQSSDSLQS